MSNAKTVTGLDVGVPVAGLGMLAVGDRIAFLRDGVGAYGASGWVAATVKALMTDRVRVITDARYPGSTGTVTGGAEMVDLRENDLTGYQGSSLVRRLG